MLRTAAISITVLLNHLSAVDMTGVACRWYVCGWKIGKDIGAAIYKSILVPFLPCLVALSGFHPYMFPHFLTVELTAELKFQPYLGFLDIVLSYRKTAF